MSFSQRNIVNRKVWADLMEKYHKGELVRPWQGSCQGRSAGQRRVCALSSLTSHLAQRYVDKISQFVGQELKLKIIEVDEVRSALLPAARKPPAQERCHPRSGLEPA